MSKMLEAALGYLERGWSIVPVKTRDKKPLVPWEEFQKRHPTKEEVAEWFQKWPTANVGIVTGKISNLSVIDVDDETGARLMDEEILSDTWLSPKASTPRGGYHLYCNYCNGIGNNARALPGIDLRSEGGFIIAPPSIGSNGTAYQWIVDPEQVVLSDLPKKYIDRVEGGIREGYTNRDRFFGVQQSATDATRCNIFEEGIRDENLFHIAYCLTKTGNCSEYVEQTLLALMSSWGEHDPKWANDKIKSAFKHIENKNRNLTEEITNWVLQQDGYFSATNCYIAQQLATKSEKGLARLVLSRLKEKGIIEKYGGRSGDYRLIDTTVNEIVIDDLEEEFLHLPLWLPFELHTMVDISEGNIILIAGEFNSGKTAWLLNILKKNKGKFSIRYMSSEMWRKEFKKRFRGFTDVPASYFNTDNLTQYIYRSSNFADGLKPGALNIIDYLEMDDYTKTAEILRQIHDKIKGGLCIVAVQKKKGEVLGRGKDMLMEKPRLAVSLYSDEGKFTAHITKAKICIGGNHDGKRLDFDIRNGCKLEQLSNWTRGGKR